MFTTPKGELPHVAFFGRRNSGKSSLINAVTQQDLATVSEQAGTTTDPIAKAMELLPIGPVYLIDTAGLDDEGDLGQLRIKKTEAVMQKVDLAILVSDISEGWGQKESEIAEQLKTLEIPYIYVENKRDLSLEIGKPGAEKVQASTLRVSAKTGEGIEELKLRIIKELQVKQFERPLIKDLISKGDLVLLVTPIDSAAPKGRLILPQVQVLREVLDIGAVGLVAQVEEIKDLLSNLKRPLKLVVTDSQVFEEVANLIKEPIPLTSFSILMARYKGELQDFLGGARGLSLLKPGDKILVVEACTHQRQHEDIGTVKIPKLLKARVGGELEFTWVRGGDFPKELREYKLIIHCGSCMLNRQEVVNRLNRVKESGVPIINYGLLLAELKGILSRTLKPLEGGL